MLITKQIIAITLGAAALTATAPSAGASPASACSPPASTVVTGTQGTNLALKGFVDEGPTGTPVLVAELAIQTRAAGQPWTFTLADNGAVFFTGNVPAPRTGIRQVASTPTQPGNQLLSAHAANLTTGEAIDAAVTVPPTPCSGH